MLKEIGEEIPETWDDLFECGSKLAAEGKYLFETANIYLWLMLTAHEEQTTGKAAADFDTENLASMMRFAKELNEGGVIHLGENYDKTNYFGGKCAGQLLWASDAQNYAYSDDSQITTVIGKYISTEEPPVRYQQEQRRPAKRGAPAELSAKRRRDGRIAGHRERHTSFAVGAGDAGRQGNADRHGIQRGQDDNRLAERNAADDKRA